MKGRIWFARNPWPKGHAIEKATWSGRLTAAGALVFDLHLETASYDAADRDRPGDDDDDDGDGDWGSRGVWTNYGRCSLSSTKWGHRGIEVGSPQRPFDWAKLDGTTLRADRAKDVLPTFAKGELPAFHIYLLGHDAVPITRSASAEAARRGRSTGRRRSRSRTSATATSRTGSAPS